MARTSVVDSATSQFFINLVDNDFLDFKAPTPRTYGYCVFGKVVSGMEVVDAIAATPTDRNDRPTAPQIMKTVTVDTFGVDYPEPKKLPDPFARFR